MLYREKCMMLEKKQRLRQRENFEFEKIERKSEQTKYLK
jgi:hypothetical protein